MDAIIRALFIYVFLLIVVRLSGKRTMSEMTPFDFVLLLIIGEATQQALLSDDYSLINAAIVILTLISADILMSILKQRSPKVGLWTDGTPLVIFRNGQPIKERMNKERIDESDILEAARKVHGLESLDQIEYAILEKSGNISVVPKLISYSNVATKRKKSSTAKK
jgi:uncharacterized membrane protein YcaP (DUF421 family)